MTEQPKISVLVPCYNVERYLRQCIDSILASTFTDMEVLCLNDGSTDSTLEILKEYAAQDQRVVIIDKPNSGYGSTMNIGLEKAKGKWIAIVESDDYIEPAMMEKLITAAEENDLDLARCLYTERNEVTGTDDKITYDFAEKFGQVLHPHQEQRVFAIGPSIWVGLYRKDFLDRNGIRFLETPGASYQDTAFAFKVYAAAERIMFIPEYLHNYRINSNSSVSSPGKLYCVCDEEYSIRQFAKDKGYYEVLKGIMALRMYGSYKWNYNRLATYSLKRQFARRWADDVKEYFKDGAITRRQFSKSRITRLKILACCPWVYMFTRKF